MPDPLVPHSTLRTVCGSTLSPASSIISIPPTRHHPTIVFPIKASPAAVWATASPAIPPSFIFPPSPAESLEEGPPSTAIALVQMSKTAWMDLRPACVERRRTSDGNEEICKEDE